MNTITKNVSLIAVITLAALGHGAAMAQGLTRAEVVAELQRARASGELEAMQSEFPTVFGAPRISLQRPATALAAKPAGKAQEALARLKAESHGYRQQASE